MGLQESGPHDLEDPRGVGYHWSVLGTRGGPGDWDKLRSLGHERFHLRNGQLSTSGKRGSFGFLSMVTPWWWPGQPIDPTHGIREALLADRILTTVELGASWGFGPVCDGTFGPLDSCSRSYVCAARS
jgi:hypothetical protein